MESIWTAFQLGKGTAMETPWFWQWDAWAWWQIGTSVGWAILIGWFFGFPSIIVARNHIGYDFGPIQVLDYIFDQKRHDRVMNWLLLKVDQLLGWAFGYNVQNTG